MEPKNIYGSDYSFFSLYFVVFGSLAIYIMEVAACSIYIQFLYYCSLEQVETMM